MGGRGAENKHLQTEPWYIRNFQTHTFLQWSWLCHLIHPLHSITGHSSLTSLPVRCLGRKSRQWWVCFSHAPSLCPCCGMCRCQPVHQPRWCECFQRQHTGTFQCSHSIWISQVDSLMLHTWTPRKESNNTLSLIAYKCCYNDQNNTKEYLFNQPHPRLGSMLWCPGLRRLWKDNTWILPSALSLFPLVLSLNRWLHCHHPRCVSL